MDPLLVFPTAPPELAQVLDLGGWTWKSVPDLDTARAEQPADGWVGAVVVAGDETEEAFLRRLEDDRTRGFLRAAAWAAVQDFSDESITDLSGVDVSEREQPDAGLPRHPAV